jgi:2-O-(6-phospho-alpha-D-mannosyl)-D-glycerate hydrolase
MRYWVVPHTHWDREWYLPFEHFRYHLARTVDEVIDVLERQPSFSAFTLDGQAVVLEDYLEVRPEREGRLRRLIAEGRIAIGPWYTLPDEYLVGQESLVRNLLAGRAACEQIARPMKVGYMPDTFGHIAQLPQILRGFGLDAFVFWRGLGDEGARVGAAFTWRGPDGSEVLAVRQLGGYGNADDLGEGDPVTAVERVRELTSRFGERYTQVGLDDFLLMNGSDHRPIRRGLPELLADCERRIHGASFRIATIEQYVDQVRPRVSQLDSVSGELCGGGDIAVLRGVNSARMYLKQANEKAERELFVAEALASLAFLGGTAYPAGELRIAWRELLRNHPHDSICGCSVDEVHRDMAQRFETARSIARVVQRSSLAALAGQGPPWAHSPTPGEERSIVNVLPWARRGLVELELPRSLARARKLVSEAGAVQIDSGRALLSIEIPGLGARQVRLARGNGERRGARVVGAGAIANERYRVEAAANGTLVVTDLASDETLAGVHLLEDRADRGDEYNFCALEGETAWTSAGLRARTRVVKGGPVVAEVEIALDPRLPHALRGDRTARTRATASCPVRTRVRLVAGVDRVEFRTCVDNRASDHRLRVLFPTLRPAAEVRVEAHFAVLRRPPQPIWRGRWSEPPQTTHHTLGALSAGGLSILTRGLPEYEALPRPDGRLDLALTLLRCVGWLSRGDLSTRFHHAGPALETPEAQCHGHHVFEYALALGDPSDAGLVRASHDYRVDFAAGPAGAVLPPLAFEGGGFALAALKQAEDGDGLIARVYNPGAEPTSIMITGPGSLERGRLDETGFEPVDRELTLRPYELATLRLRSGRPSG